jgi:hypothetical protein
MGYGVASGFVTGALTGAISYHIDDEYAWGVDKNVLEYGNDNNRLADAAKYVSPGDYDVRLTADGGSEFDPENNIVRLSRSDYIDNNGNFSAERFWNVAEHEGGHYNMTNAAFKFENSTGRYTNSMEWSNSIKKPIWEANHTYAQEYILKSKQNIRFFNQYSPELQTKMISLQESAYNMGKNKFGLKMFNQRLDYYRDLGFTW